MRAGRSVARTSASAGGGAETLDKAVQTYRDCLQK
jgi:hypothetical protein